MKVFQENWTATNRPWFLFWIFFSSFIITVIITIRKKIVLNRKIIFLGFLMGIPNMLSSYFLIESLKNYSAVIVYPVVNIGIIILTSIFVKLFWKEQLNSMGKLAMAIGILSIGLLSL
jgi:drug/metabolite transporter (DMT)-like permease